MVQERTQISTVMDSSRPDRSKARIVVAGQVPPPYGGQNINTDRVLRLLEDWGAYEVIHLRLEFSKGVRNFRKFDLGKIWELFRVAWRIFRIRIHGRVDLLVVPTGGPHMMPVVRDILLLPLMRVLAANVWVQFRAGGIARELPKIPWMLRWLLCMVHKPMHGAIVATRWGVEDPLALGIEKVRVIPNGLEDYGSPIGRDPNGIVTLLNVGHLSEVKGTPQLIQAFGKVAKEIPGLRLRLVGEFGDDYTEERLREEAGKCGVEERIDLVGLVSGPALFDEYKRGDLFVFPSVAHESFGMVMVEAMMCSLPIVALDWRANREVLTEEFGGVICPFEMGRMEEGLERGLREALENVSKWKGWGESNRQVYLSRYGLDCLKQNWMSFFEEEMKGRH